MRWAAYIIPWLLLPPVARAQTPVAPCTDWMATVDGPSQRIVLSWRPSADSAARGYHICTGMPCLDYDTVFGRLNTTYVCPDHLPTEQHTYRLHVFDSARNVSALTPSFGPVVLRASLDPCAPTVTAEWSPYVGLPEGSCSYSLLVHEEPGPADLYRTVYTTAAVADGYSCPFAVADSTEAVSLVVEVAGTGTDGTKRYTSRSNLVSLRRMAADTAARAAVAAVAYDSVRVCNVVSFEAGAGGPYTLWRGDSAEWTPIAELASPLAPYADFGMNPYRAWQCYRLSSLDDCGNEHFSPPVCIALPTPPEPAAYFPNAVLVGDPANGTFRPVLRGYASGLYRLHVYNRAGLQVFSADNPAAGWTPRDEVPQGAYTYILRCRFIDNRIRTFTGTVLLLK